MSGSGRKVSQISALLRNRDEGDHHLTDEELMLAYATDDMEAFERLYRRHKSRIFGFLTAKLQDQAEAEDVFQVVFTKLHVARGKYRPEIPFLPGFSP